VSKRPGNSRRSHGGYHDELTFRRPFRFGSLQFSNPCGPAGGDPRASSPTCGSPKERRRVVHFGVTEHPTEEWTMQQMREAFPWDQAPRYVHRDAIYGRDFAAMTRDMGMQEVLTAPISGRVRI
jgi:hypothetical protein